MTTIYPVIMCGGAGTRLWPLSRKSKAKQYHALVGEQTMLQDTISRMKLTGPLSVAPPSFVCAANDGPIIERQCRELNTEILRIILEPIGRNTAPLAAIVSEVFHEIDPEGLVLLLPADHHIADPVEFWNCVVKGSKVAQNDKLLTLGIEPQNPSTGYGYIKSGASLANDVYEVEAFVEKPDLDTAKSYLASGNYYWNAGIFLFAPKTMLDCFHTHAPNILKACKLTLKASTLDGSNLLLDDAMFRQCPADSIDYAIMERADNVSMVAPVNIGWSDIGSWSELANLVKTMSNPDQLQANIISLDCTNTYMRTDGPLIAGVGLENMIVVVEKNRVLIVPKDRAQDVKKIVDQLKASGRGDHC